MKVPLIDLVRQYHSIKQDVDKAIAEVLESGMFIMGRWVGEIETEVARLVGAKHGIGVASGTDALEIGLIACGVSEGDEVITTPFSFVSVAEVAVKLGAKPVFVDIDEDTFNLDVNLLEEAITLRTKAIVPVHLFGQSADMDPILAIASEKGISVIEDAAQAIGALYKNKPIGSLGKLACFSFFPTKNLGCYGDGGMIVTDDDSLAEIARSLRRHGEIEKYKYTYIGMNSRLDSIQAAILLAKIRSLKAWNEKRRKIASLYNQMLEDLPVRPPHESPYAYHIYHQYTIRTEKRDQLREFLKAKGIATAIHYPLPIHLQAAYRELGYTEGDLPRSERASREVLSLPIFPEMENGEVEYVGSAIKEFFGG